MTNDELRQLIEGVIKTTYRYPGSVRILSAAVYDYSSDKRCTCQLAFEYADDDKTAGSIERVAAAINEATTLVGGMPTSVYAYRGSKKVEINQNPKGESEMKSDFLPGCPIQSEADITTTVGDDKPPERVVLLSLPTAILRLFGQIVGVISAVSLIFCIIGGCVYLVEHGPNGHFAEIDLAVYENIVLMCEGDPDLSAKAVEVFSDGKITNGEYSNLQEERDRLRAERAKQKFADLLTARRSKFEYEPIPLDDVASSEIQD